LGLQKEQTRRIVFHEITRDAILNAVQTVSFPDRLVGFELSRFYGKNQTFPFSGRVQSVAVKLTSKRRDTRILSQSLG
jgi:DNA topoisomerase-1